MIDQNLRPANFGRAANYERFRIGYSNELFDALEKLGFARGMSVLDAGCGTGIAMRPLAARGMAMTGLDLSAELLASAEAGLPAATFVTGRVEELPFAAGSFDAAVSAQAFHRFDADRAFAELIRVVKPGGPVAVWWKILGSDDPMRSIRAAACVQVGVEPAPDSLRGGFNAFYRAPFAARSLRVLNFSARITVDDWVAYERSRGSARDAYGDRTDAYVAALRTMLIAKHGSPGARIEVRYSQFLYVGTTATSS